MSLNFRLLKDESVIYSTVDALFKNAADPPVFYSAGMLKVFKLATAKSFCLAVLLRNKLPIIALPIVKNGFWQNVNFPGWDNLDVLKSTDATTDEIETFWKQLLNEIRVLKLNSITQNSSVFAPVVRGKHFFVDRRKCPYVPLFENREALNEVISKKLVRNLRQYGNKALRDGIVFRIYESNQLTHSEKVEKLELAFAFHDVRMSKINQDSKFTPEAFASYHKNVLTLAENMFLIEAYNASEEIIACFYGLSNNKRLAYFNGGYNQDYAQYSIGTLLVSELIDYGMERGIRIFDFLRGNESYKQKWTEVYDLNKDVYLSDGRLINKTKAIHMFFQDTRKRIGTKNAFKEVFNSNVKTQN